jgi:hypothetical protein
VISASNGILTNNISDENIMGIKYKTTLTISKIESQL